MSKQPDSGDPRQFAIDAHGTQKYGRQPYVTHLDAVASLVESHGQLHRAVAYLHDTVEDTAITQIELMESFGPVVARCVELVTDKPVRSRAERKRALYDKLKAIDADSEEAAALIVKAADRLANVRACLEARNRSLFLMYKKEHPAFREAVYRPGLADALWQELDELATGRAPRRTSWLRASVFGLLLIGGLVGGIVGLGLFTDKTAFRPEVRAVLEKLSDGRAEQVYEESSHVLRETLLKGKFLAMAERLQQTLGRFVEVGKIHTVERTETLAGQVGYVHLDLEFQRGVTTGELSFQQGPDGTWLLLGVRVRIPASLEEKWGSLERQYDEIKAPAEVISLAGQIMEDIRDGNGAIVYEEASEIFKESKQVEAFRGLLVAQEKTLGTYVRTLAIIASAQNKDKTRARVTALLEYDRTKTTATFDFVKVPASARRTRRGRAVTTGGDASEVWQLSRFKINIPEPLLPSREP